MEYEALYNSACGIIGHYHYDEYEEFVEAMNKFKQDNDLCLLGYFDMSQDADFALEEQGFTLDQITKWSMHREGERIEYLKDPETDVYWVFISKSVYSESEVKTK